MEYIRIYIYSSIYNCIYIAAVCSDSSIRLLMALHVVASCRLHAFKQVSHFVFPVHNHRALSIEHRVFFLSPVQFVSFNADILINLYIMCIVCSIVPANQTVALLILTFVVYIAYSNVCVEELRA